MKTSLVTTPFATSPQRCIAWFVFAVLLLCAAASGQRTDVNYDEAKVGKYTLPDPLVLQNGERVRDAAAWNKHRRPEILKLFESNVYGRSPGRSKGITFEQFDLDKRALDGKAIRKQVTVYFTGKKKDGPKMDILLYLPAAARKPVPVFLVPSFSGNYRIHSDPGIKLGEEWPRDKKMKVPGDESKRGTNTYFQVEKVLAGGYGLAVIYYCDIEPDFVGGIQFGVRPLFYQPGQTAPAADEWGAIGAWAWGLSRALDYLETDKDVDARRVVLMGHSRLGKTALWAGAQDARFAVVIANGSGEGGAALSRRTYGETVKHLNTNFPHWFCGNYKQFSDHVDELPVDQHMLLALIAPRPVYLGCAEQDQWADPRGEFLSAVAAGPVYRLLGKQGLDTDQMPPQHQPIMHTIGFHYRAGKHEVTTYDWDQFLLFAEKHLGDR
ncbi:MAG TPA: acetylxylan esterase [Acidobacteriota bacterium]|jgi:hypothetical protein|nr:acetylxylan esterase [Acidobacteriota bacterium]